MHPEVAWVLSNAADDVFKLGKSEAAQETQQQIEKLRTDDDESGGWDDGCDDAVYEAAAVQDLSDEFLARATSQPQVDYDPTALLEALAGIREQGKQAGFQQCANDLRAKLDAVAEELQAEIDDFDEEHQDDEDEDDDEDDDELNDDELYHHDEEDEDEDEDEEEDPAVERAQMVAFRHAKCSMFEAILAWLRDVHDIEAEVAD